MVPPVYFYDFLSLGYIGLITLTVSVLVLLFSIIKPKVFRPTHAFIFCWGIFLPQIFYNGALYRINAFGEFDFVGIKYFIASFGGHIFQVQVFLSIYLASEILSRKRRQNMFLPLLALIYSEVVRGVFREIYFNM